MKKIFYRVIKMLGIALVGSIVISLIENLTFEIYYYQPLFSKYQNKSTDDMLCNPPSNFEKRFYNFIFAEHKQINPNYNPFENNLVINRYGAFLSKFSDLNSDQEVERMINEIESDSKFCRLKMKYPVQAFAGATIGAALNPLHLIFGYFLLIFIFNIANHTTYTAPKAIKKAKYSDTLVNWQIESIMNSLIRMDDQDISVVIVFIAAIRNNLLAITGFDINHMNNFTENEIKLCNKTIDLMLGSSDIYDEALMHTAAKIAKVKIASLDSHVKLSYEKLVLNLKRGLPHVQESKKRLEKIYQYKININGYNGFFDMDQ
ncbi:MAG: hypothetical protein ACHP65_09485 [Legionellales bacterium]